MATCEPAQRGLGGLFASPRLSPGRDTDLIQLAVTAQPLQHGAVAGRRCRELAIVELTPDTIDHRGMVARPTESQTRRKTSAISSLAYEIAIAWGCWGLADCRSTELAVPNPAKAERSAAVVFRVEPNGSSRRLPAAVSVIVGA